LEAAQVGSGSLDGTQDEPGKTEAAQVAEKFLEINKQKSF
jgi:hypothetical protein